MQKIGNAVNFGGRVFQKSRSNSFDLSFKKKLGYCVGGEAWEAGVQKVDSAGSGAIGQNAFRRTNYFLRIQQNLSKYLQFRYCQAMFCSSV